MALKGLTREEAEFAPPPLMEMMQKFASLKGSPSETVKMTVGKESGNNFEVTLQFFRKQGAEKAETITGRASVENGKAVVRALDGSVVGRFERDDLFVPNEAGRRTSQLTPSKVIKKTITVSGLPVEGAINSAVREAGRKNLPPAKAAEIAVENVKKNRLMRESELGKSGVLEKMQPKDVNFIMRDGKETKNPFDADSTKGITIETQGEGARPGKSGRPAPKSAIPSRSQPPLASEDVSFSMRKEGKKTVLILGGPAAERIIGEAHGDRLGMKNLMLAHPELAEIARNAKIEQISAITEAGRRLIKISGYMG